MLITHTCNPNTDPNHRSTRYMAYMCVVVRVYKGVCQCERVSVGQRKCECESKSGSESGSGLGLGIVG